MLPLTVQTTTVSNNFTLSLENIDSNDFLLMQFQSNSTGAQVKSYYVTEVGKVRVILTESIPAGKWKINVLWQKK